MQEKPLVEDEVLFWNHGIATHMWYVIAGKMCYKREGLKQDCGVDTWVSEASLWVTGWQHRGEFVAVKPSNVVGLNAEAFRLALERMPQQGTMKVLTNWIRKYAVSFISDSQDYIE